MCTRCAHPEVCARTSARRHPMLVVLFSGFSPTTARHVPHKRHLNTKAVEVVPTAAEPLQISRAIAKAAENAVCRQGRAAVNRESQNVLTKAWVFRRRPAEPLQPALATYRRLHGGMLKRVFWGQKRLVGRQVGRPAEQHCRCLAAGRPAAMTRPAAAVCYIKFRFVVLRAYSELYSGFDYFLSNLFATY